MLTLKDFDHIVSDIDLYNDDYPIFKEKQVDLERTFGRAIRRDSRPLLVVTQFYRGVLFYSPDAFGDDMLTMEMTNYVDQNHYDDLVSIQKFTVDPFGRFVGGDRGYNKTAIIAHVISDIEDLTPAELSNPEEKTLLYNSQIANSGELIPWWKAILNFDANSYMCSLVSKFSQSSMLATKSADAAKFRYKGADVTHAFNLGLRDTTKTLEENINEYLGTGGSMLHFCNTCPKKLLCLINESSGHSQCRYLVHKALFDKFCEGKPRYSKDALLAFVDDSGMYITEHALALYREYHAHYKDIGIDAFLKHVSNQSLFVPRRMSNAGNATLSLTYLISRGAACWANMFCPELGEVTVSVLNRHTSEKMSSMGIKPVRAMPILVESDAAKALPKKALSPLRATHNKNINECMLLHIPTHAIASVFGIQSDFWRMIELSQDNSYRIPVAKSLSPKSLLEEYLSIKQAVRKYVKDEASLAFSPVGVKPGMFTDMKAHGSRLFKLYACSTAEEIKRDIQVNIKTGIGSCGNCLLNKGADKGQCLAYTRHRDTINAYARAVVTDKDKGAGIYTNRVEEVQPFILCKRPITDFRELYHWCMAKRNKVTGSIENFGLIVKAMATAGCLSVEWSDMLQVLTGSREPSFRALLIGMSHLFFLKEMEDASKSIIQDAEKAGDTLDGLVKHNAVSQYLKWTYQQTEMLSPHELLSNNTPTSGYYPNIHFDPSWYIKGGSAYYQDGDKKYTNAFGLFNAVEDIFAADPITKMLLEEDLKTHLYLEELKRTCVMGFTTVKDYAADLEVVHKKTSLHRAFSLSIFADFLGAPWYSGSSYRNDFRQENACAIRSELFSPNNIVLDGGKIEDYSMKVTYNKDEKYWRILKKHRNSYRSEIVNTVTIRPSENDGMFIVGLAFGDALIAVEIPEVNLRAFVQIANFAIHLQRHMLAWELENSLRNSIQCRKVGGLSVVMHSRINISPRNGGTTLFSDFSNFLCEALLQLNPVKLLPFGQEHLKEVLCV